MRFIKSLRFDIRLGKRQSLKNMSLLLLLSGFLFIHFIFSVFHIFYFEVHTLSGVEQLHLSYGDLLLYELGGILPMLQMPESGDTIPFPTLWLLFHIFISYTSLHFLQHDLSSGGIQVIVREKSKTLWLLSKYLWTGLSTALLYATACLTLFLLTRLTGNEGGFSLNGDLFAASAAEALPQLARSETNLFLSVVVLPCLVGVTISLAQMLLTLFMKPVIAFLATCSYYIAGIYYANPVMLSNYAMPVRSAEIGIYNFDWGTGMILCAVLSIAAVIAGVYRINHMDLATGRER